MASLLVLIFSFAFVPDIFGQNANSGKNPSDAELEQYVEIDLALGEIRRDRKKAVMKVLQDSELGVKGYREASSKGPDPEKELSEEKKETLKELRSEVKGVQKEYRKKEEKKIEEMGMEASRYKEIDRMMENEKVRKRMLRIKEKKMEEAQEEDR